MQGRLFSGMPKGSKFGSGWAVGVIFALLSAATYGLNPVLGKLGYATHLTGIQILHERFLFAVLILAALGPLVEKDFYRFDRSILTRSGVIAVFILVPMNLLYVYALADIPASLMSLITYVYPLVVLVLNRVVFGRQFTRGQLISVFFVIGGCLFIFSDALELSVSAMTLCIAFGAMFFYGTYLLALQQLAAGVSALQITFLSLFSSTLLLSFAHNPFDVLTFSFEQTAVVFTYGLVSTVFATFFLSRSIQELGATEAGIFCSFEPVFTIGFAALLLGEEIPLVRSVGMVLLVLGILIPNWGRIVLLFRR